MFNITSMELVFWDYWERVRIPLDDKIVLVIGPNGSGKTTILDALRTLLGKTTSSKRDYKRYAAHSRAAHTWIIGTIDNTRRAGRRPFGPQIADDKVTIACRIQKKGGEWPRDFYIRAGEATFEELNASATDSLGLKQYVSELEKAGLTKAISKVLSLEQGATDKLCEYSPKELLTLIYDVFGDKATLDNYEEHRRLQKEADQELREFELNFATMKNNISELNNRANNYLEYSRLEKERIYLDTEAKAIGYFVEYTATIEGFRRNILGMKTEIATLQEQISPLEQEVAKLQDEQTDIDQQITAQDAIREETIQRRNQNYKRQGELSGQLNAIAKMAAEISHIEVQDINVLKNLKEGAITTRVRLRDEKDTTLREAEAYSHQIEEIKRGVPQIERTAADFSNQLRQARIPHAFLFEGVDLKDEKWAKAIESVLRGYRYVIMLDDKKDKWKAWDMGEKTRYRHFIVPTTPEQSIAATKDTALSVVNLSETIPAWVRRQLAEIYLIEKVDDAKALPQGTTFVTVDGYMMEKRGGRYIGITDDDFIFGASGRKKQVAFLEKKVAESKEKLDAIGKELAPIEEQIREIDNNIKKQETLSEYLQQKSSEEDIRRELSQITSRIQEETRNCDTLHAKIKLLTDTKNSIRDRISKKNNDLDNKRQFLTEKKAEYGKVSTDYIDNVKKLHNHRTNMPKEWKAAAKIEEYKQKFTDLKSVERDLGKVQERLQLGTWEKDPTIIKLKEKMEFDYQAEQQNLTQKREEFEKTREAVQRARETYLHMLKYSVENYEKNLKNLASLAGVDIDVEKPPRELTEDDLRDAGITIRWNFDSKGFSGTDDGDASGGQQVLKSLILLVALMTDIKAKGGFIFIDEPFAHLDILNIDRVVQFLRTTDTQFIITSPDTHNLKVYRAAGLCLNTKKKMPNERYTPVPSHIRRDAPA